MKTFIVRLFKWFGYVQQEDLDYANQQVAKRFLLLHHGEVPRAVWHLNKNLETIRGGTIKMKELILFCCPKLKGNLQVNYPPKGIDCDIASNLPAVFEPDENYPTIESFVESLKMFIPNEKMELNGKFLNITYPKDLLDYNVGRVALCGK